MPLLRDGGVLLRFTVPLLRDGVLLRFTVPLLRDDGAVLLVTDPVARVEEAPASRLTTPSEVPVLRVTFVPRVAEVLPLALVTGRLAVVLLIPDDDLVVPLTMASARVPVILSVFPLVVLTLEGLYPVTL